MNIKKRNAKKLMNDSLKMFTATTALATEAWARSEEDLRLMQSELDNRLWQIDKLKGSFAGSERERKRLLQENAKLKEEILNLKADLQERDNILDRISATHNPLLIAELVESESA